MNSTKLVFSLLFTLLSLSVLAQEQQRPPAQLRSVPLEQLRQQQPAKPQPPQPRIQPQQPARATPPPAQQGPRQAQSGQQERVELQSADSLEGGTFNGRRITKLLGNVVFKQKETFLYADSVYQF